jgi:citrate synthase
MQINIWPKPEQNDPFRLMGFGHRVYKISIQEQNYQKTADEVLSTLGLMIQFFMQKIRRICTC